MTKPTLGIQAITIQPIIAIPGINPGIFTVAIFTLTSLLKQRTSGLQLTKIKLHKTEMHGGKIINIESNWDT